mmetsp:Transcript_62277/g.178698  ORF Transcript_62277/g.178698 Transcript_62277/m.178698 type:complete len:280 (+) Transcript_62277:737-1576(+)
MRPGALDVHGIRRHRAVREAALQQVLQLRSVQHDLLAERVHDHVPGRVVAHAQLGDVLGRHGGLAHRAQQVQQRVVVHLHHRGIDAETEVVIHRLDDPEELRDGARGEALLPLVAVHRVGLARAGLAVGEDRDVVAVHGGLDEVCAVVKDLLLIAGCEQAVEVEHALGHLQSHAVDGADGLGVAHGAFPLVERSDAAIDADLAFQVLDDVVDLAAQGVRVHELPLLHANLPGLPDDVLQAVLDLLQERRLGVGGVHALPIDDRLLQIRSDRVHLVVPLE